MRSACGLRPWGQIPEWKYNMPVCLSGRLWGFCNFCIHINFQCGGSAPRCVYPHTGVKRTPVGSSRAYMSIFPSLCPIACVVFCNHPRVPQLRASHAAASHGANSPVWQYNISVHSSVVLFYIFIFVLIYSMGVQCRDAFIPSEVQLILCFLPFLCLSICLFVSPYLCISLRLSASLFGDHLRDP